MSAKSFSDIPKAYDPSQVEDKWYKYWIDNGIFNSDIDKKKKPYTIAIPPPNITGMLTMGHVLNNSLQDIFIRTKRMQGYNACWVPGTDHASIATETKVTKFLADKQIDKYQIGREAFIEHCQAWKKEYGGIIIQQLKKLGVSCDWRRERFTMDDEYYHEVIKAFVELYNEGKIYRGYRMVNWDPANKSAISDEEVIFKTVNGKLWYFKYPVLGSEEFVVVATTRPETMLGDTGVAVNPNDERYKHLIGKKVLLPIAEREIPIFADDYVDMEFGTGVVKVTPAHDVNDYDMGQRHKLELINIFNDNATTNNNVPKEFRDLDRYEVRKKVVTRIDELGLLHMIEDYQNKVGYSERGNVPIEPYLSEQWFMKMSSEGGSASGGDDLVTPAIKAVQEGRIRFYPKHWEKTYFHWMEGIRDWCISRQLWWGHRIPVWYCVGDDHCNLECKQPIVSITHPEKCPHCGSTNLRQDEDVLDTWASSWLWAHAIFKTEEERKYYYPTNTLVTGPDIIFFWVARMIMAGMHFQKDIPFSDVYFTSIIRDVEGRKMSKSLGNSPDPLNVIKDYGADALRFTVIYLAPLGQDVLFSTDKCELGRNFANKIWNAGRFLLMNAENIPLKMELKNSHIDFADEWIISRLNKTLQLLNKAMDEFEVNNAIKLIYSFIWNDFCDWYVEMIKNRLYADDAEIKSAVLTRAISIFEDALKMLHPFMPFITEELWQLMDERKDGESISTSSYPFVDEKMIKDSADEEMDFVKDIITAIRNIRGEMNIAPSKKVHSLIKSIDTFLYFNNSILISEVKKKFSQISNSIDFNNIELSKGFKIRKEKIEKLVASNKSKISPADTFLFIAYAKSGNEIFQNWFYQKNIRIIHEGMQDYIKKLAKVEDLTVDANIQKPKASASAVLRGVEIFIPLEGLIDLEVERQKIQKEITRLEGSLAGIEKKLSNEKFVANAAPEVVEKERAKQKDWLDNISKLKEILNNLN